VLCSARIDPSAYNGSSFRSRQNLTTHEQRLLARLREIINKSPSIPVDQATVNELIELLKQYGSHPLYLDHLLTQAKEWKKALTQGEDHKEGKESDKSDKEVQIVPVGRWAQIHLYKKQGHFVGDKDWRKMINSFSPFFLRINS